MKRHIQTVFAVYATWRNWLLDQAELSYTAVATWHRRLVAAQHYHGRHRPKDEAPPFLHWMDAYRGRIQHWIATHPGPTIIDLQLGDTQDMILPDFDDPNFDLAHAELSGGSAQYLRLRDAMLDAEIEAVFTRTETNPVRLPLRVVDYDDDLYAEAVR